MNRLLKGATQAIIGIAIGLSVGSLLVPAAGATSTGGLTGYAAAQIVGGSWGGGYVQTQVVNLEDSVQGSYANEEMWVTGMGGTQNNYLEVGYTIDNTGCRYNSNLEWFTDEVYNGSQIFTLCGNAPSSLTVGSTHLLEIQQTASETWVAYVNGSSYYQYSNMPGNTNTEVEVGLEYHESDYLTLNGPAYFNGMEVRDTSCCTWQYWPSGEIVPYPTTYPPGSPPPYTWTWTQYYSNGYND